jgi:hypothetical protein
MDAFVVDYVGIKIGLDGIAVENASGDAAKFAAAVATVRGATKKPLILMAQDAAAFEAALAKLPGESPLLYAADAANAAALAAVAKKAKASLAVKALCNRSPISPRRSKPPALKTLCSIPACAIVWACSPLRPRSAASRSKRISARSVIRLSPSPAKA